MSQNNQQHDALGFAATVNAIVAAEAELRSQSARIAELEPQLEGYRATLGQLSHELVREFHAIAAKRVEDAQTALNQARAESSKATNQRATACSVLFHYASIMAITGSTAEVSESSILTSTQGWQRLIEATIDSSIGGALRCVRTFQDRERQTSRDDWGNVLTAVIRFERT